MRARWVRDAATVGRSRPAALLGLVVVALVAGCSAGGTPAASPAQTAPAADCLAPQVIADLGLRADARELSSTSHPDVPAPGSVPAGFEPVSVVECVTGEHLTDTKGVWDAVTVRRLEGDLGPLLAVLAAPSATSRGDQVCPATHEAAFELWLVDALGRAIRPARPVDACGSPGPAVQQAVVNLKEIEVSHYRVHLAVARATAEPTAT